MISVDGTKTVTTDMLTKKEMKEYIKTLKNKSDYWINIWEVGYFPHQRQRMNNRNHYIYIVHPKEPCITKVLNRQGAQHYRYTLTHHPQKGGVSAHRCYWCCNALAEEGIEWHLKYTHGGWTEERHKLCTRCRKIIGNQKKRVRDEV